MDTNKMFEDPTDEDVAQFLKEWDEGKRQLSDEAKDALSTVGFRRSLQFSLEITRLQHELSEARAEIESAKQSSAANWNEALDHERWLKEMCEDYKLPFDPHKVSMRCAINGLIHKQRDSLTAANQRIESLEKDAKRGNAAIVLLNKTAEVFSHTEEAPWPWWWKEYFLIDGAHMILTDEGWESGDGKEDYERQAIAEGVPLSDFIKDEVNAPAAIAQTQGNE